MTTQSFSAIESKVYDLVMSAGEHGIGLGTVAAKLGTGGATAGAIASLLRSGALEQEAARLFAL